jgi:hypothetical protein
LIRLGLAGHLPGVLHSYAFGVVILLVIIGSGLLAMQSGAIDTLNANSGTFLAGPP